MHLQTEQRSHESIISSVRYVSPIFGAAIQPRACMIKTIQTLEIIILGRCTRAPELTRVRTFTLLFISTYRYSEEFFDLVSYLRVKGETSLNELKYYSTFQNHHARYFFTYTYPYNITYGKIKDLSVVCNDISVISTIIYLYEMHVRGKRTCNSRQLSSATRR